MDLPPYGERVAALLEASTRAVSNGAGGRTLAFGPKHGPRPVVAGNAVTGATHRALPGVQVARRSRQHLRMRASVTPENGTKYKEYGAQRGAKYGARSTSTRGAPVVLAAHAVVTRGL
jgi:hypothetical protein